MKRTYIKTAIYTNMFTYTSEMFNKYNVSGLSDIITDMAKTMVRTLLTERRMHYYSTGRVRDYK